MITNFTKLSFDSIIEGCIAGDRKSQQQLYKLYASKLYPVCLSRSSSTAEAGEKLVNLFVSIFNQIHRFNSADCFESWAITLMPVSKKRQMLDLAFDVAGTP